MKATMVTTRMAMLYLASRPMPTHAPVEIQSRAVEAVSARWKNSTARAQNGYSATLLFTSDVVK